MLLKTYSSNSEAGPAVSRKPEQTPYRGPFPTCTFLGLMKDAGLMTFQKLHESHCRMGWSSPSSLHQLLPVSTILIACGFVVTNLAEPTDQLKTNLAKTWFFPPSQFPDSPALCSCTCTQQQGLMVGTLEVKACSFWPHQLVLAVAVQPLKHCKT